MTRFNLTYGKHFEILSLYKINICNIFYKYIKYRAIFVIVFKIRNGIVLENICTQILYKSEFCTTNYKTNTTFHKTIK